MSRIVVLVGVLLVALLVPLYLAKERVTKVKAAQAASAPSAASAASAR